MGEIDLSKGPSVRDVIPPSEDFEPMWVRDRWGRRATYVAIAICVLGLVAVIIATKRYGFQTGGIYTALVVMGVYMFGLLMPGTLLQSMLDTKLRKHPEHLEDLLTIDRLESVRWRAANVAATYAEMLDPVAQQLTTDLRTLATSAATIIDVLEQRKPLIKELLKPSKT